MEQRYMGECGGLPTGAGCHTPWGADHQLSVLSTLAFGRTAIGERVWDICRMIDVLEKHFDMLDIDNVCCMGSSGGGTATFYAACVEERIKACISSVAVCTFKDSIIGLKHCPCNYIQGIARYFDMGDLALYIEDMTPGTVTVCGKITDITEKSLAIAAILRFMVS